MSNSDGEKIKSRVYEELNQIIAQNHNQNMTDNQIFEKSKNELFQKAENYPMMDNFIENKIKKNRDFWKKKYQLQLPNLFPGEESVPIKQQTYQKHLAENHENDP